MCITLPSQSSIMKSEIIRRFKRNNQNQPLTHICIRPGVTTIRKNAFAGCDELVIVEIPPSVTTIEDGAFSDCVNLISVVIGEQLNNELTICDYAFSGCTALSRFGQNVQNGEARLPSCVREIKNGVFSGCIALRSVYISDNLTSIGDYAFSGCTALSRFGQNVQNGEARLPSCVREIKNGVFSGCIALRSVYISDNLTSIGDYAFAGCRNLCFFGRNQDEISRIPETINRIGSFAFYGTALESIQVSENVTAIWKGAFAGCKELRRFGNNAEDGEAVIPDSVTEIGAGAFYGCISLQSVVISDQLIRIGNYAFSGCTNLNRWGLNVNNDGEARIPNTVREIGYYTFAGTALETVIIDDRDSPIGKCAFSGCTQLLSVTFPRNTRIESYAFANCIHLECVNDSNREEDIMNNVFGNALHLFVNCPRIIHEEHDNIDIIEEMNPIQAQNDELYYVYEYSRIKRILFRSDGWNPDNINIWDSRTMATVPDDVTEIGRNAFSCCDRLNVINNLPNTINGFAFVNCRNLLEVNLNNVRDIAPFAFAGCTNLQFVGYRNDCNVKDFAFAGCSNIPDDYRNEHVNAFDGSTTHPLGEIQVDQRYLDYIDQIKQFVVRNCNNLMNWTYMWPMTQGTPREGTKYEANTVHVFSGYSEDLRTALRFCFENPDNGSEALALDFPNRALYVEQAIISILKWGGLRAIKTSSEPEDFTAGLINIERLKRRYGLSNIDLINNYLPFVLEQGRNGKDYRIAFWSKVLAAYLPGAFFIYDSRVAIALSHFSLVLGLPCFWKLPNPSDNREGDLRAFREKCRNRTNQESDLNCYYLYLHLLKELANTDVIQEQYGNLNHEIRDAYNHAFNFEPDAANRTKMACMAHIEKMLFMMKEPIFESFNG